MHQRNGMALKALPGGLSAMRYYEQGFNAALVTLAIAFGLMPTDAVAGGGAALSREPEGLLRYGEHRR